jgi:hypothetical protein
MLQDDDVEFGDFRQHPQPALNANPFADVRNKLAAVGMAIHNLHPQVHGVCIGLLSCKYSPQCALSVCMNFAPPCI